jgi:Uncharacterised nucleotidyltransferase
MNRQADLAFLGRALSPLHAEPVGALRDDLGGGTLAWESVVDLASRHLITPVLYQGLADKGLLHDLPAEVRTYLEAVHELNGERNRRIADQLQEIIAMLNAVGIEPVLLKGVAYLVTDLYRDPAARVIGDIDLLVPNDQLAAAVAALTAIGYREAGLDDFSFAAHHHHTPLARQHDAAAVELHTEAVAEPFTPFLPTARILGGARRVEADGRRFRLPAPQDQIVHNIVHTQLTDRHYWLAQVPLRPLSDLARLRLTSEDQIDWQRILVVFDRAGHGSACRAWLLAAEQLLGQYLPGVVRPNLSARIACWRIRSQSRHRWLKAAGEWYGYHRAILAELRAGPASRRRLRTRLLHPNGYQRYFRALRRHMGRAH